MRQFTLFAAIIAAMGAAYASSPAAAAVPVAADGFVDVIAAGSGQTVFIPGEGGAASGFSLADALTLERKASLWWEYARDVGSVTARLTRAGYTTLLVPTDDAIMALSHKPHNNPSGGTSDKDAQRNVEDFLSAHIVPADLEPGVEAETLNGVKVTLTKKDDGMVVTPGDARVVGEKAASNGKIYFIDGIVKYD